MAITSASSSLLYRFIYSEWVYINEINWIVNGTRDHGMYAAHTLLNIMEIIHPNPIFTDFGKEYLTHVKVKFCQMFLQVDSYTCSIAAVANTYI